MSEDIYVNDVNLYEESFYTISLDWQSGNVWIIDHVNKKKFILTRRDSDVIARNFELYQNSVDYHATKIEKQ